MSSLPFSIRALQCLLPFQCISLYPVSALCIPMLKCLSLLAALPVFSVFQTYTALHYTVLPSDPAAAGDGGMRVWKMSSTVSLLCTIRAAVNRLDSVNSTCCDAQHQHVVVGDTGGHIRVWKVDPNLYSSAGSAAEACFTQVSKVKPVHSRTVAASAMCNSYIH